MDYPEDPNYLNDLRRALFLDLGIPLLQRSPLLFQQGMPLLDTTPAPPGTRLNEAPSFGKLIGKG